MRMRMVVMVMVVVMMVMVMGRRGRGRRGQRSVVVIHRDGVGQVELSHLVLLRGVLGRVVVDKQNRERDGSGTVCM